MELALQRRFFAEEIEAAANLKTAGLVDALATVPREKFLPPGGRLLLPITVTMPVMGPIGKGTVILLTRGDDTTSFDARAVTFVAIYSAHGLRNESLNEPIGNALQTNPFPRLKRLRRDAHEPAAECWLHGNGFCLSL